MANEEQDDIPIGGGAGDDEILEVARKRFLLAQESEIQTRIDALDDLNFLAGNQWPEEIKNARAFDNRPCLTINRLPQFLKQVTNDQRQNRPSIKVNPVDENANLDTAKVFQGLIRHIESNSNADVAYDTAFEGSAGKGLGYFRVLTDWCDPMSFTQEIIIKRIRNSFTVYLDPNYQEPDGSDANWGFVFENMPFEDFKAQFGESKLSTMTDWESLGDRVQGWVSKSTVRVAEYFYKSFKSVDICLMSDNSVALKSEVEEAKAQGLKIVKERKTTLPAIKWVKMNAVEVLERNDWAGQWIPIVPVLGDEIDLDGKRILQGIIRNAKDPQRMYNYWNSSSTETIALAPRAPYIGAEGSFEGHENQWATANVRNHPYLEYKPQSLNGQPAPPPQRNVFEPPINAITQVMMHAADDMKATTGIYDSALGNRSNENSGVAIQRRNAQSQTGNFHFIDNLSRSLRHCGRICIDLIPHIYDTPSAQRILGEDGAPEIVLLNQVFQDKNGQKKIHKMGYGKYDCTVATGPSYATKRQEAVASMLDLNKTFPKMAEVAGDLMVKNMDWQGAQEVADRLKKTLPPGIADDSKNGQPPIPPQAQQQIQQMGQAIDQLTKHLHAAQDEIEQKTRELQSKERIALAQIQADLEINLAKLQAGSADTLLEHQIAQIQRREQLLGMNQRIENGIPADAGGAVSPAAQMPQGQAGNPAAQPQPTGGQPPGTYMGV